MAQTSPHSSAAEHPFAAYVRILGKGKTGSRSLDRSEAAEAFAMILRDEVQPLQLGAFLMLLRVKEETPAELAGFVDACRAAMAPPPAAVTAQLDWSSYAGKRRQHPWYLLSLLILAGAGYRVFVHGGDGHSDGRLYTEQAMTDLGLPVADNWDQVGRQLDEQQLSYLPLRCFCPRLHAIMQLRPLLGLRSPVNTLVRMLNPLRAAASVHSIFHPAYGVLQQQTDRLLQQPRSLVFKGDSGEVETKPQANTRLLLLEHGSARELTLPRTLPDKVAPVAQPETAPLRELWQSRRPDAYGREAVIATAAAALLVLEPGWDLQCCRQHSEQLWQTRDQRRLD